MRFHLLANSHLDPVWLWDWREGLNEGIATCRTVLRLMDEFPELTYLRGETSIYAHIAEHDPATLDRIRAMIAAGRWDVVGGTLCQPDTNLPSTEVLCRHFTDGLDYLARTLQQRPTAAWAADSFGHSAGWPEIYAAAGMESFAFSRPFEADRPLPGPAFWWCSAGGRRVLCWRVPIGWYGSERGEVAARLDAFSERAAAWGVPEVAVFFGLGNHGGGPSQRQVRDILRWRERNRDITVEFSTLHRFFAALRTSAADLPVFEGELNFTLRGCYTSAARFKFAYRRTENLLLGAERTSSAIAAAIGMPPPALDRAWQSVLFNTFHDILPGSAIERAFDDQLAWLGVAYHEAQRAQLRALNALAASIDTRVPEPPDDHPAAVPVLLWNPHPQPFEGHVEVEVPLDYRPIFAYRGRPDEIPVRVTDAHGAPLQFQSIAVENHFSPDVPWRKRLVAAVTIPPMGWRLVQVAWDERARPAPPPRDPVGASGRHGIRSGAFRITARPGQRGVTVLLDGRPLFGRSGLTVATFEDPYGSWGNHDGEREGDDISTVRAPWTVQRVRVLESGPLRAALWVQLGAGTSRLDLTFHLEHGSRAVRVSARLLWNERSARLKLVFPGGDGGEYEVPGGTVRRGPCGEVPGGRWVRVTGGPRPWTFASDALYGFDAKAGEFRATIVRSTRYAWNSPSGPDTEPWRPHVDLGEHRFQFVLAASDLDPWALSAGLEQPIDVLVTHPHEGRRRDTGSLFRLAAGLRALALKPAVQGTGWILRVQVMTARIIPAHIHWQDERLELGRVAPGEIVSWRLTRVHGRWRARRVNAAEEMLDHPPVAPRNPPRKTVPCPPPDSVCV